MTVVYWRSAWRYQERGYRRVLLDAGHVIANTIAYAPHEGCRARPVHAFLDGALNGHFFFDDGAEAALLCAPLLEGGGPQPPAPLWASPLAPSEGLQKATLRETSDLKDSATVALHRASSCDRPAPAPPSPEAEPSPSEGSVPLEPPGRIVEAIPNAIVERRSARGYTGQPVSLERLGKALGYAFGRTEGDRCVRYATREAGLLRAHLVVHEVEDIEKGVYLVEGAGEALRLVREGDIRQEFYRASLGQEIARRCAAALVLTAPARPSLDLYGARAYRYLHVEAGMLGERLQLGAAAQGLGACGIAGFLDDEAAEVVGADRDDDFVLYFVTVGRS
jgi:SagB-type dehydrogenase family enzyme